MPFQFKLARYLFYKAINSQSIVTSPFHAILFVYNAFLCLTLSNSSVIYQTFLITYIWYQGGCFVYCNRKLKCVCQSFWINVYSIWATYICILDEFPNFWKCPRKSCGTEGGPFTSIYVLRSFFLKKLLNLVVGLEDWFRDFIVQ